MQIHVHLFVTSWSVAHQFPLPSTTFWSLLKFTSFGLVMLSNYFILCHPLLLLPSIFPNIKVFSNESTLHINWPKYWSLSFSNCPWFPSGLTGLISMLSKESQESSPAPQFENINYLALNLLYSPTLTSAHNYGKNHSFPRQIFVGKVMSLLFNILSRLVIAFLPRSKCLLIVIWLNPFHDFSSFADINWGI